MKVVLLASAVVFGTLSLYSQEGTRTASDIQSRVDIAGSWLDKLCVLENSNLNSVTPQELDQAFDKWIVEKSTPLPCKSSSPASAAAGSGSISVKASSIRLNIAQRLARMGQFQADFQQTPDYVYGVPEGSPAGTANKFLPNPQHKIASLGGPIYLSELYVGADTRVGICSALGKDADSDPLCDNPEYISARRIRDNFSRIGAAVTVNINFAQVPRFQSPILISTFDNLGIPTWSKSITGSFAPAQLFRSTAEKKALGGYAGQITHWTRDDALKDLCPKGLGAGSASDTSKCIKTVTIGGKAQRLVISLLPNTNVKVTSPFDLAKFGSTFLVPPDKAGRSLYDVTFTWDLRNVIAATSSRLDAFNAIKAAATPAPLTTAQVTDIQWRRRVAGLYCELIRTNSIVLDERWWNSFRSIVLTEN